MSIMRRRLACCSRDRGISIDFDEQERVTTYDGLENCILNVNQQSFETESHTSRDPADSLDDKESVCSTSKDPDGISSLSLKWLPGNNEKLNLDDWEGLSGSPQHFYVREKPVYAIQNGDIETMKEKFAKLLLGEDSTGGCKGVNTALALSNAITSLAATVFGELWKLEPLSEERKSRWRREMDWLLSPTKYMVQLVPAKQKGADGCILEIMTPIARADIHMNLPALQKLDSMLIEFLDAMVNTEFWYAEGGSRAEGRSKSERKSKRWWLPSPQVPRLGLSDSGRKKLMCQGRLIHQVFKAATSINESVLQEMPIPIVIRNALPKSGKANLSDELYKVLATESGTVENMFDCLRLKSEHRALDCLNKLEAAVLAWKEKIAGHESGKSPRRSSWSFMRDPLTELDRTQCLVDRAESLIHYLKYKYPNLPQTFIDATKVQFGKDIGHAILEAYSRVLGNLSYSILSRIKDILQEDIQSNPNSPALWSCYYSSEKNYDFFESPVNSHRIRHSLIDRMNRADCQFSSDSCSNNVTSDSETSSSEAKTSSVMETPSRNRVWCTGKDVCISFSPSHFP